MTPGLRRALVIGLGSASLLVTALVGVVALQLPATAKLFQLRLVAKAIIHRSGSTAVMGDSIVQRTDLSSACTDTFNGGVGGTVVGDARRLAPILLTALQPKRVIVAIGVNDAQLKLHRSSAVFRDDYAALLDEIGPRLAGVVEVNPVEDWHDGRRYDHGFILEQNAIIRAEAARRKVPVISAPSSARGLTEDGVHFNAAGQRAWLNRLSSICRTPLVDG